MAIRFRRRKDGSIYTQVRFRHNGRETSVSFDDHAEALKFQDLLDKLGAAKAMEISRIVAAPSRATTLRHWLDKHNANLTGVDEGTLNRYKAYVVNDIGPALGDIPLTALSRDDVTDWINAMAAPDADGNTLSGKTIANKHGYLAGALNAAVAAGHIKANPCDGNRLPRWDREEMVFLERDEFQILLANVPAYWKPLVEFLVASGARWSEATALKPAAVDRKAGTVRITKAWKTGSGGYRLGVPKTKMSVRTINVPTTTLDKLDYSGEWLFTNSGRGKGQFADGVIAEDDGPVRIQSFNPNVWTPAVARAIAAGLPKKPRVHDLRHTCASWLIQAGRPLPAVQAHLGHESITTTVNTYGHLDRSSGAGNADVMAAALATLSE
jgi:integrase